MKIDIKTTNMDLTDAIRDYVYEKINSLDKFVDKESCAYVEVGRASMHHNKAEDNFLAEVKVKSGSKEFFARAYNVDLYAAVDAVKEEIQREINKTKNRDKTLFIRGARSIKKRVKGMKPWWRS